MGQSRTICQVIDYGGSTGGSFIPGLSRLAREISRRGDRCAIVATRIPGARWHDELRGNGADVHLVSSPSEVRAALKALRPEIVHAHFTRYDIAALTGMRSRTFWHVHSYREQRSLLSEVKSAAKYRILGRAIDGWMCVSQSVRDEIVRRGASPARAYVVHNGIDTDHFRPPTEDERRDARDALGIGADEKIVLFFDRTPVKGGAVLRQALAQRPQYRLVLNGGPDADWASFRRESHLLTTGRVADTRPLYWAADVLAFPSFGEGFGYVLSEAAACGLPIAASDIQPVRELLGGSADAFTFAPGDSAGLVKALDRAFACGRPQTGRTRMVAEFSLERWAAAVMARYDA